MTELLLRIEDLVCWHGSRRVVNGLSLDLRAGEILGLIGPNGSGKTTVLNVVSGLHPAWHGHVRALGVDLGSLPAYCRSRMGIERTFQTERAFWQLRLIDATFARWSPGKRVTLCRAVLDRLAGVTPSWWKASEAIVARAAVGDPTLTMGQLSAGQLRALSEETILAKDPRLLLLDEPFCGLSPDRRQWLTSELERLSVEGKGIVIVDHDLEMIVRLCHRVILLDAGKMAWEGPAGSLWSAPVAARAFLGERRADE